MLCYHLDYEVITMSIIFVVLLKTLVLFNHQVTADEKRTNHLNARIS